VLLAGEKCAKPFEAFNVASGDYITVTEIADLACGCLDLPKGSVRHDYTGSDRGWKGDVPIVRLNIAKIRGLGWQPTRTSAEALRDAMLAMLVDLRSGLDQGAA
jgi:UDP-glucose 4-epimerase